MRLPPRAVQTAGRRMTGDRRRDARAVYWYYRSTGAWGHSLHLVGAKARCKSPATHICPGRGPGNDPLAELVIAVTPLHSIFANKSRLPYSMTRLMQVMTVSSFLYRKIIYCMYYRSTIRRRITNIPSVYYCI